MWQTSATHPSASSTVLSAASTVARAVLDQLPHEPILYLGDTARQPYGPRPIAQVRAYALECLDRLVDQGVKALVIACNSASSAMLRDARERYDVPVIEVIHPATSARRGRHPQQQRRRHLHRRHQAVDGLRGRVRRGPAHHRHHPGLARASSNSSKRASPAATNSSKPRTNTSNRSSPPTSTPSSSAARTTRC
ncbi:glutamate racemase [Yinghuangia aomiensis]